MELSVCKSGGSFLALKTIYLYSLSFSLFPNPILYQYGPVCVCVCSEVGTFGIGRGISVLPKVKICTEYKITQFLKKYRNTDTESWGGNLFFRYFELFFSLFYTEYKIHNTAVFGKIPKYRYRKLAKTNTAVHTAQIFATVPTSVCVCLSERESECDCVCAAVRLILDR